MHQSYSNKAAEYWEQAASIRTIAAQIFLTDVRLRLLQTAAQREALVRQEEKRQKVGLPSCAPVNEASALPA